MSHSLFKKLPFQTFTTAGTVACFAVMTAIAAPQSQAVTISSTFTVTPFVTVTPQPVLAPVPAFSGNLIFTRTPIAAQPGFFDYEVTGFTASIPSVLANLLGVPSTYTLSDLRTPANLDFAQALVPLLPNVDPGYGNIRSYGRIIANVIANTPEPDDVDDEVFPPLGTFNADFSSADVALGISTARTYLAQLPSGPVRNQVSNGLTGFGLLFPNGGRATVTNRELAEVGGVGNPATAAVPEPTTMAGLALAGAGLAAARRRKQKTAA